MIVKKFIRISVQVCRGVLSVWWKRNEERADAYYAADRATARTDDPGVFITYERDGVETQVLSVADLLRVIRDHGCSPMEEIGKNPAEFAVVLGFLLNLPKGERVIEQASFWRFLDEAFDVSMNDLVPRVVNGRFEFDVLVTVAPEAFGLVRYDSIIHVSVELGRGSIEKRTMALKPRGKNAFFATVKCPHCHTANRVEFQALIGVLAHESFYVGDVVIKSVPPEPTDGHPVGPSVECVWERPFWATGKGWCPACYDELTARIEIRERRFSEARPTLEVLDLFAWGSLPDAY